jgi:sugar phosphate isomerase/epimerase
MQFGWCGSFELADDAARAGLDYLELQVGPLNLEDDAASVLYPGGFRVVGPDVDDDRNRSYMARVVELLSRAGASVVVFGSGRARDVPEGFSRMLAMKQLRHMLGWCADLLMGTGITLAIEPLNTKETNIITSVAEAVALAGEVNRPPISALADFYHMDEEHDPLTEAWRLAKSLAHVHVADTGRLNPGTGQYNYGQFFTALKVGGYRGMISAECSIVGDRVAAMTRSVKFMREKWDAA